MRELEIREVTKRRDKRRFVNYPFALYKRPALSPSLWTPPLLIEEYRTLDSQRNKWFLQGEQSEFIAVRKGRLVGRIAAHVDHGYVNYQSDRTGFFGFFECDDDHEAAKQLFAAAESRLLDYGVLAAMGPINQSPNQVMGCLVDGFENTAPIFMGWNPGYYDTLIQANGYTKEKDLLSYRMDTSAPLPQQILRIATLCKEREQISIRRLNLREFDDLLESIRNIYNEAWADKWGFVPWTREQFVQLGNDLKPFIHLQMLIVAEHAGRPVGFALAIPDHSQLMQKIDGRLLPWGFVHLLKNFRNTSIFRVAAFGIKPAWRARGVDALFVYELYTHGIELGCKLAEFSWIAEDNYPLRNMLAKWGAQASMTHRIYRKELT